MRSGKSSAGDEAIVSAPAGLGESLETHKRSTPLRTLSRVKSLLLTYPFDPKKRLE